MTVYSVTNRPQAQPTCSGNKYEIEYVKAFKENGNPYLKEVGKINIQKKIESALPPDVNQIMDRALYGDTSLLEANGSGVYADVSELQGFEKIIRKNAESLQIIDKAMKALDEIKKEKVKENTDNAESE